MRLTVLGSGSAGNGYVLQNDNEALVLECGMPIKDCLAVLGWDSKKVAGCLLTHEHGDHAKYVDDYMKHFRVYTSAGTASAIKYRSSFRPTVVSPVEYFELGGFQVMPFEAEHDAAQPFCFLIDHEEIGRLLFATDTYFVRYTIQDMTAMMVECNYSLPILNENVASGLVPEALKKRTLESHMSITTLKKMLDANDLSHVSRIVLIHTSGRNGDKRAFVDAIEAQTGIPTSVAEKGLTIEILKTGI